MKQILRILVLSTGILPLLAASALAADARTDTSHFYDMSAQHIAGVVQRPATLVIEHRERARFGRLLSLKKSFIPAIVATAKEKILQ